MLHLPQHLVYKQMRFKFTQWICQGLSLVSGVQEAKKKMQSGQWLPRILKQGSTHQKKLEEEMHSILENGVTGLKQDKGDCLMSFWDDFQISLACLSLSLSGEIKTQSQGCSFGAINGTMSLLYLETSEVLEALLSIKRFGYQDLPSIQ